MKRIVSVIIFGIAFAGVFLYLNSDQSEIQVVDVPVVSFEEVGSDARQGVTSQEQDNVLTDVIPDKNDSAQNPPLDPP